MITYLHDFIKALRYFIYSDKSDILLIRAISRVLKKSVMATDYYSQDVPAAKDEPEVLESLPVVNDPGLGETTNKEEQADPDFVIEEDTQVHLKSIHSDFESKVKAQLLYNFTNNVANKGFRKTPDSQSSEVRKKNRLLKFTMLESELRALMVEMDNDSENTDLSLKKKIDQLVSDIECFKLGKKKTFLDYWDKKLTEQAPTKERDDIEDESEKEKMITLEPLSTSNEPDTMLLELESRISNLESILGFEPSQGNAPSIQDSIEDLYTRVNLVLDGGSSLKSIEDELNKLITNCEIYIKDSKRIRDKSEIIPLTDKKLCHLYEKVKSVPDFPSFLEVLLERFKFLNQLIMRASASVNFLQGLEGEFSNIEHRLDSWDQNIDVLSAQLDCDRKKFDEATKILAEYKSKN